MTRALSFEYDRSYVPAAPFIQVTVDGYDPDKQPVTVSAFVDTGADGTLLPHDILMAVGAEYEDTVLLRGTTGSAQRLDRYTVRVRIEAQTIYAVSAVATAMGSEPILSRDVLNDLIMTLHGPAGVTEVEMQESQ